MKRILSILFTLSFFHSFIFAQTSLSQYVPGVTAEGAVYFLPKTAIRVTVQVEKTTYTPGDFCAYADRFLRIKDVPSQPFVSYRITNIRQSFFAIADTTKAYAVKFDARTSAANITLSDDGVLLAVNGGKSEVRGERLEVRDYLQGQDISLASNAPSPLTPHQYLSEEILAAGSKAKMAELTAQEIYEIRESRNLLVRGQADYMPKDGEQLRLMLSQLEQQDKALSSLFTGITQRDTINHDLIITPSEDNTRELLFRFSQKLGLVDKSDLAGVPYYINVENLKTIPQEPAEAKKKHKQEQGIYVNVPGKLRSSILNQLQKPIITAEAPAGQFGNVELLSGALFNKRYTTHLWLNPLSGAVEKLEAEMPK